VKPSTIKNSFRRAGYRDADPSELLLNIMDDIPDEDEDPNFDPLAILVDPV
jgi:hypothetical protein